ncbi:restriction endonuclease [Caenimonas aquaedulcis]|nr:restriction endonuclease [Caenimonas aquaedulcis]
MALFVISFLMPSLPALVAASNGIRIAAPYPLLLGFFLLAAWAAMRPRSPSAERPDNQPAFFGKDSTDFVSQLPRKAAATPPPRTHRGQRPPAIAWSQRVFDDIEWRRFELVCSSLFGQGGFETRAQSHGADGGVDIWLYSQHAEGPAAVVQCKHWIGRQGGVKEMREFFGVMSSHKLQRGTFATSSTFTADAQRFAKDNGISALDGQKLLALIATRTPVQQVELLQLAYEGEYWRPTCASCGIKMVERDSRKDGKSFWGCANFPKCRSTLPIRQAA